VLLWIEIAALLNYVKFVFNFGTLNIINSTVIRLRVGLQFLSPTFSFSFYSPTFSTLMPPKVTRSRQTPSAGPARTKGNWLN
jgi:hypothetical protein